MNVSDNNSDTRGKNSYSENYSTVYNETIDIWHENFYSSLISLYSAFLPFVHDNRDAIPDLMFKIVCLNFYHYEYIFKQSFY